MFDRNPKSTPADVFIAGKTTEAIVRKIAADLAPDLTLTAESAAVLLALVARFDRKVERREAAAA